MAILLYPMRGFRVISGQCARGAPRRNEAEMARKEREWLKQVRKMGNLDVYDRDT